MSVGPSEVMLAVMLLLLALVAAASGLALLAAVGVWATSLVGTPVVAGFAAVGRHRRWLRWHPPTDWTTGADLSPGSRSDDQEAPPVRDVAVVSSDGAGARVRLIAAGLPLMREGGRTYAPGTMVHARLEPTAQVTLPAHAGFSLLIYVLDGEGFVGPGRRFVSRGQLVIAGSGDAVVIAAADDLLAGVFEVLVLGETPACASQLAVTVVDRCEALEQRLRALQAFTRPLRQRPAPVHSETDPPSEYDAAPVTASSVGGEATAVLQGD